MQVKTQIGEKIPSFCLVCEVYFRLSKKFETAQKRHVEKIVLYSVKNAAVVTKADK